MSPRKAVWPRQAIISVRVSEIFSELVVDERFFQNTILNTILVLRPASYKLIHYFKGTLSGLRQFLTSDSPFK